MIWVPSSQADDLFRFQAVAQRRFAKFRTVTTCPRVLTLAKSRVRIPSDLLIAFYRSLCSAPHIGGIPVTRRNCRVQLGNQRHCANHSPNTDGQNSTLITGWLVFTLCDKAREKESVGKWNRRLHFIARGAEV